MMTFLCGYADGFFTMGVNDTLLVYPNLMANNITFPVSASFSGYSDEWGMIISCPSGMAARVFTTGDDMSIPYLDSNGAQQILVAPLSVDWNYTEVSSKILDFGYWDFDNDGDMEPYGTIKWDAGDYDDMYDITFQFEPTFTGGSLTLIGSIKSTPDYRQNVIFPNPTAFSKTVTVVVGYRPGDVNGDHVIDTSDVTMVISYATGNTSGWDQYMFAAGDINGDGVIDINDVTALIAMVLSDD